MSKISLADVLDLSVAERIQLAEDIWDTIPKASEAPKITDAQRAELDRRLEAHRKNPDAGSSWEDVKARILGARDPACHFQTRGRGGHRRGI